MAISLSDFINQNTGQHVGDGQCVALVSLYAKEVLNTPLPALPSAVNYWKALPGYTQESSPQIGDIAVYNSHPGFPDGHIAIVNQLGNPPQVFEQNADPDGSPAHLYQRSTIYLLGYQRRYMITKENENAHSVLATGSYPGKDYDYRFVGTNNIDGQASFWLNVSETEGLIFKAKNPTPQNFKPYQGETLYVPTTQ